MYCTACTVTRPGYCSRKPQMLLPWPLIATARVVAGVYFLHQLGLELLEYLIWLRQRLTQNTLLQT